MFIAKAYAAADAAVADAVVAVAGTDTVTPPEAPGAMEAFMLNMLLIMILVGMFYVLLIMPQQKRFAQHREMLGALKKGDRVVTIGGLIGTIDSINEAENEAIIDLGNGTKVTALRSSIQGKPQKPGEAPLADKKKAS